MHSNQICWSAVDNSLFCDSPQLRQLLFELGCVSIADPLMIAHDGQTLQDIPPFLYAARHFLAPMAELQLQHAQLAIH